MLAAGQHLALLNNTLANKPTLAGLNNGASAYVNATNVCATRATARNLYTKTVPGGLVAAKASRADVYAIGSLDGPGATAAGNADA